MLALQRGGRVQLLCVELSGAAALAVASRIVDTAINIPSCHSPPSGYSLTQAGLHSLRGLCNLSALRVSSCPAISDSLVAQLLEERGRGAVLAAAAAAAVAPPAVVAVGAAA